MKAALFAILMLVVAGVAGCSRQPDGDALDKLGLKGPVSLVSCEFYKDGGTKGVEIEDADGRKLAMCRVSSNYRRNRPELSEYHIGALHPEFGGKAVKPGSDEEKAIKHIIDLTYDHEYAIRAE